MKKVFVSLAVVCWMGVSDGISLAQQKNRPQRSGDGFQIDSYPTPDQMDGRKILVLVRENSYLLEPQKTVSNDPSPMLMLQSNQLANDPFFITTFSLFDLNSSFFNYRAHQIFHPLPLTAPEPQMKILEKDFRIKTLYMHDCVEYDILWNPNGAIH
jgi:hypothetical protein